MLKKLSLKFAALCLPVIIGMVALPATSSALFESSIDQACQGANLSDSAAECADSDNGATRIEEVIQLAINILTIVVGVAAVIMIIINGLRFITANGDSASVASARNGILYAVVGLIVVALAQAIVRFVVSKI